MLATGRLLHSSEYKNGQPLRGSSGRFWQFGLRAGDLSARAWRVAVAVGALGVNVLPRDLWGMPILEASKLTSGCPKIIGFNQLADYSLLHWRYHPIWFKKHRYGQRNNCARKTALPLLDIGTMRLIREGHITVYRIFTKS